jgi:hypothetical protein
MATAPAFYLPLDKTGISSANLIVDESHTTTPSIGTRLIIPKYGAFYSESLRVYSVDPNTQVKTILFDQTHYLATEMLRKVTMHVGKSICTVILILPSVSGNLFHIDYQALGGKDQVNSELLNSAVQSVRTNQAQVNWSDIQNKPIAFSPAPHLHDALDLYGLEYITDSLNEIKYAVDTGDEVVHRGLITYLSEENQGFYDKYNNDVYNRVDVITALNRSAEETLKTLSVDVNELIDSYKDIPVKLSDIQEKALDYRHLNKNDSLANVSNLLCKRQFDSTGELIDLPLLFDDLYLYLDSNDYNPVTFEWLDKRGNGNGFITTSAHAPDYGLSYTRPTINSVKFTTGQWMEKTLGFNLNLIKGRTVIVVAGHRNENKEIKIPILSGATRKLDIDVKNEIATRYSDIDNQNVEYLGKTSKFITDLPFVNIANIGVREKDCLCLNNTPYSYYRASNGIDIDQLHLDAIGEDLTYLGHPILDQDAEVFMFLIYQRELSKVEMHSILTYIRLKYGCNVNCMTNPSFEEGNVNISTDLSSELDFVQRDSFKITGLRISALDTQNNYSDPDFLLPEDITLDDNEYMFVCSKSPNLCFWRQEVKLEPNVRYEFKYSIVYGLINPPIIRLKINGLWHAKTYTLDGSRSVIRDITYTFITNTEQNTIELFNLNPATTGNSFGIDQMSLVRMIYATPN